MPDSFLPLLGALLAGGLLGALLASARGASRRAALGERLRAAEESLRRLRRVEERAESLALELERERARREADQERLAWIHTADEQLRDSFRALAGEALEKSSADLTARSAERLERVVGPMEKVLSGLDAQVRELEKERRGAYEGLKREVGLLRDAHRQLGESADDLRRALGSSGPRGRWAEIQLRRLVELAGLLEHVDFAEQTVAGDGLRPDLVVRLPGRAVVPVDAKAPMSAWLEAAGAESEAERDRHLEGHLQALRRRTADLGGKEYWRQFDEAPDFVVMYLPHDAGLAAAFERDPGFLDHCVEKRVLPATPVTLLALLKSVAWTWRQERLASGAREIAEAGRELHRRLGIFLDHLGDAGRGLDAAVGAYNRAVGSLERRLLPAVRRLEERAATADELEAPSPLERTVRELESREES